MFPDTPPEIFVLCMDALLGIGATRVPQGRMADWIERINAAPAPVLAIDIPTGLNADTGATGGPCVKAHQTLSLLSLKPGLFTARGRDMAGQIWFDALSVDQAAQAPTAL